VGALFNGGIMTGKSVRTIDQPSAAEVFNQVDPDTGEIILAPGEVPIEQTAEDRLIEMVQAQLGESPGEIPGKVTIKKMNPDNANKYEWVDSMLANEFQEKSIHYIAANYGAGEYEIFVYGVGGKIASRHKIPISAAAGILRKTPAEESSPEMRGAIEAMQATMKAVQELAAIVAAPKTEVVSPVQTRAEMLQEFAMMKEIFGGSQEKTEPVNPFEMIKSMGEVMKDLNPGEGDPTLVDQITKFAEKFGPYIEQAISASKAAPGAPQLPAGAELSTPYPEALRRPAVPQVHPGAPTGAPQPTEDNAEMFQKQLINYYLNLFVDSAANDEGPEPYAEMIINKVPHEMVQDWLTKESLADELAKFNPAVLNHKKWFNELREILVTILAEIAAEEKAEIAAEEKAAAEKDAEIIVLPPGAVTKPAEHADATDDETGEVSESMESDAPDGENM